MHAGSQRHTNDTRASPQLLTSHATAAASGTMHVRTLTSMRAERMWDVWDIATIHLCSNLRPDFIVFLHSSQGTDIKTV